MVPMIPFASVGTLLGNILFVVYCEYMIQGLVGRSLTSSRNLDFGQDWIREAPTTLCESRPLNCWNICW
jgi:hypothetical protein